MKKFLALLPLIAIAGCGSPTLQQRCVSALQAKRDLPEYWFRNGKTGYVIRETFAGNKKIVWQFAYQDPQKGYTRMRGFCNWNKATDEINRLTDPSRLAQLMLYLEARVHALLQRYDVTRGLDCKTDPKRT